MDFVLGQGGRVGEGLADVFLLEVRELGDDLRRRHPVCDEVDDMRDRDPQAADRPVTLNESQQKSQQPYGTAVLTRTTLIDIEF